MTDTDTALCQDCQIPVDMPKARHVAPGLMFQPIPLCKDCILRLKVRDFMQKHLCTQPFKFPGWRPTHAELSIADEASRSAVEASRVVSASGV